jgi:hypothetical protein
MSAAAFATLGLGPPAVAVDLAPAAAVDLAAARAGALLFCAGAGLAPAHYLPPVTYVLAHAEPRHAGKVRARSGCCGC